MAWRALVDLVDADLKKLLSRCLRTLLSEVVDLRQDVYEKLIKNDGAVLRAFRGERSGALRRYVLRIASALAMDHLRSKKRSDQTATQIEAVESCSAPAASPERATLDQQGHERFERELLRLADGDARNLMMLRAHFSDGLSAGDIARLGVGLVEKSVDTFLRRAADKLTAALRTGFGDER
jgi:RNA polymerase sigma factor (sigma-70 family)